MVSSDNKNELIEAFKKKISTGKITYVDLKDLKIEKEIGEGSYGKVYLAKLNGSIEVALKEIKLENGLKEALEELEKEIKFIEAAMNDSLPKLYGVTVSISKEKESIGLLFEFIRGEPLNKIGSELNNKQRLDVVLQLTNILIFLHGKKLIHRDIKPHNIMIEPDQRIRLIDFGVSKICSHTITNTATSSGSAPYMAPENFDADIEDPDNPLPISISTKADIWSVGCLISNLFSGLEPWGLKNSVAIEYKLSNKVAFPIPKEITLEPVKNLIKVCTAVEPKDRPDAVKLKELIEEAQKQI